jgi:hypothetical protein
MTAVFELAMTSNPNMEFRSRGAPRPSYAKENLRALK